MNLLATIYLCLLPLFAYAADSVSFKFDGFTEEESSSEAIPNAYKCDACKAVAFQLDKVLKNTNAQMPLKSAAVAKKEGKRAVQDRAVRITSVLESACATEAYESYGIKDSAEQPGTKWLVGEGIVNEQAGAVSGGGKWLSRLRARCAGLIAEIEDLPLVELWLAGTLPAVCDSDCGKGGEVKQKPKKNPSSQSKTNKVTKPSVKAKLDTRPPTGLEELPPPPYVCQELNNSQVMADFIEFKKGKKAPKFKLVVFYDTTEPSARLVSIIEHTARKLAKAKERDLRTMPVGRYDSRDGHTWGYAFKRLPGVLFFRRGYRNPKKFDGQLSSPDSIIEWLKEDMNNNYLKDDPSEFPRDEL